MHPLDMDAAARDWFRRRTFYGGTDDLQELTALKRASGASVSVCLPALDESSTIGSICERISTLVELGFVDELVVVDTGSTDDTREVAAATGASVRPIETILPELPAVPGKGEALWRSLAVLRGDLVVYLDADLRNFDIGFVTHLVEPLLRDPTIALVKAFYDRYLPADPTLGGGRVTELVARPLLNLFYPELKGLIQPLAGEYAARVDALKKVPFFCGYAVEIGLLIDLLDAEGVEALAQVDLGERVHRNRPTMELGPMAFEIIRAVMARVEADGRAKFAPDVPEEFVNFPALDQNAGWTRRTITLVERPPMLAYSAAGGASFSDAAGRARDGTE